MLVTFTLQLKVVGGFSHPQLSSPGQAVVTGVRPFALPPPRVYRGTDTVMAPSRTAVRRGPPSLADPAHQVYHYTHLTETNGHRPSQPSPGFGGFGGET